MTIVDSPCSRRSHATSLWRRWLVTLGLVTLALLAARGAMLWGLVRPVRIAGSSMAPALLGPHLHVRCRDCRFPVVFGQDQLPPAYEPVCSNCGSRDVPWQACERREGDRVLIDRGMYLFNDPRRGHLVALHQPGDAQHLAVKRVVGLPGETISLSDGDLVVNGRRLRKSLTQLRDQAVLVHDDRFRPENHGGNVPDRWRGGGRSGWQRHASGYEFVPKALEGTGRNGFDWLSYHHWRGFAHPGTRTARVPIRDDYAYNQAESRTLHSVGDLLLTFRCSPLRTGQLAIRLVSGADTFELRLAPAKARGWLWQNGGQPIARFDLPAGLDRTGFWLDVATCDEQVLVAIDDRQLLRHAYRPSATRSRRPPDNTDGPSDTVDQLAIGARGGRLHVQELQVWRDLFYLDPLGQAAAWEYPEPLGEDEFLVLGDNVPVSQDSRHWQPGAVGRKSLVGRVLRTDKTRR